MWNRYQSSVAVALLAASSGGAASCSSDTGGIGPAAQAGSAGGGLAPAAGGSGSAGVAGTASANGGAAGTGVGGSTGASGAAGTANISGAAGTGGASTPCRARPGLLFCDDFESASAFTAPWSASAIGEGTTTLEDGPHAHSGSKSVHVHGTAYQTLLVYHDPAVLPRPDGKFYVRVYLRLAEPMTGGHNTFLIADTFAAPNAGNALRVGEQNAMLMMTVGGDAHGYLSNQNFYNDGKLGAILVAQQYSCLELLLDAPHTEIRVWLDGKDVPDLHVTDLAHENYDSLRFGFEKYAGPAADIWYDDIAISTERIGCD